MINRFFNTTFTIKRMVWSGESSSEVDQTSCSGHIQQARMDMIRNTAMSFTRSFTIWLPIGTNIQIGDTIDDGNYTYSIKEINQRNYGREQHLQVLAEKNETA